MAWNTPKTDWKAADGVSNADMNRIEENINILSKISGAYGVCSGPANTYAVTVNPPITALEEGICIAVKINTTNTGASTINVNGLGAVPIKKANGNNVSANQLKAGSIYTLRYDGSNFILQGEGGEYGTATPAEVLKGYTIGTEEGIKEGTLELTGNATAQNVLSGKTFYNTNAKSKLVGTMPNRGVLTITPDKGIQLGDYGYYDGVVVNPIPDDYYGSGDEVPLGSYRLTLPIFTHFASTLNYYETYLKLRYNKYSNNLFGFDTEDLIKFASDGTKDWSVSPISHSRSESFIAGVDFHPNGQSFCVVIHGDTDDSSLVIYDSSGERISNTGLSSIYYDVAIDSSNNYIYLCGTMYGDALLTKYTLSRTKIFEARHYNYYDLYTMDLDSSGDVYAIGYRDLLKLSKTDGSVIWAKSLRNTAWERCDVKVIGNYVYAAADYILEKYSTSGTRYWRVYLADNIKKIVVDMEGNIYCLCHDQTLYKYTSDGSLKASIPIDAEDAEGPVIDNIDNIYISCYKFNNMSEYEDIFVIQKGIIFPTIEAKII